ncbi:MAG: hypothetical protein U0176_20185 [Bacteroidia bacterium]
MMRTLLFSVLLMMAASLSGCGGHESNPSTEVKPAPVPLELGKVVPFLPGVQGNAALAYYLPASYSANQKWPVVVFFDSHARGKDPVRKYAPLAEQYGLILIGSNASKNGQQPQMSLQIYDALLAEIGKQFSYDAGRMILSGFSGGARVAAMIAQNRPNVAGVIGCSAGFQPRPSDAFPYYATMGREDFNYQELRGLEAALDQGSQPHFVDFWDGGHEWPPVEVMERALEFAVIRASKPGSAGLDSLVAEAQAHLTEAKAAAKSSTMALWRVHKRFATLLDGHADVAPLKAEAERLQKSPGWTKEFQSEEQLAKTEETLRQQYVQQIGTATIDEWFRIAIRLQDTGGSLPQRQRNLRVANFLSLNVYFQVDGALKAGDIAQAEHFQKIYSFIDPPNPEHAYMLAVIRQRQGRTAEVMPALEYAQRLGFKDADRLSMDPDFVNLHSNADFMKLLDSLRVAE